ncbi:tilB-like [Lamellibrachia satsuma]|nr:tilB-like [Lamellibrachia satsuma]
MVRITEDLIRKRAEHNECIISTLEEISLHQQDIERIEYIGKWCKHLKILYLQNNLIPRIENVSRLKELEYLNLAINNVEKIENLEACESLQKLDLTVNFVGEISSIKSLQGLSHLTELYLTGNPCADFEGYRQYVIATLPQLKKLDGVAVDKSERILAVQALREIEPTLVEQERAYFKKRAEQKEEARRKQEQKNKPKKPGFDGRWYTDINTQSTCHIEEITSEDEEEEDESYHEKRKKKLEEEDAAEKAYWQETTDFTPESRLEMYEHTKATKEKQEGGKHDEDANKPQRRLQMEDGRMLNVNEAKVGFDLSDEGDCFQLDVSVFRHLDTSLCDVDVQPTYVRVTLKGKILQLVLSEEVKPDSSEAKRSQTTGHLLITMPKVNPVVRPTTRKDLKKDSGKNSGSKTTDHSRTGHERLEVDPSSRKMVDLTNIATDQSLCKEPLGRGWTRPVKERPNSSDFVDDSDVPPLI